MFEAVRQLSGNKKSDSISVFNDKNQLVDKHNNYLWFHPSVAKELFIHFCSTGKFDGKFWYVSRLSLSLSLFLFLFVSLSSCCVEIR